MKKDTVFVCCACQLMLRNDSVITEDHDPCVRAVLCEDVSGPKDIRTVAGGRASPGPMKEHVLDNGRDLAGPGPRSVRAPTSRDRVGFLAKFSDIIGDFSCLASPCFERMALKPMYQDNTRIVSAENIGQNIDVTAMGHVLDHRARRVWLVHD